LRSSRIGKKAYIPPLSDQEWIDSGGDMKEGSLSLCGVLDASGAARLENDDAGYGEPLI